MSKRFSELRGRMSEESREGCEQMAEALREAIGRAGSPGPDLPPEEQKRIDEAWVTEAERRLEAYRAGKLKSIPIEEIFGRER